MKSNFVKVLTVLFFFIFISMPVFCAEEKTPAPYNKDELPQSIKDLRRFEIVSLGSLPFVTMDVSLGFSTIKTIQGVEGYTPTPFLSLSFKPSSEGLSSSEKWSEFAQSDCFKVIASSILISAGVGLTDYIINMVKRNSIRQKKLRSAEKNIIITPISQDSEAIRIELPENQTDQKQMEQNQTEQNQTEQIEDQIQVSEGEK